MSTKYSEKEKRQILARYAQGDESIDSILKSTGIARSTLFRWIKAEQEAINYDENKFSASNYHQMKKRLKHYEGVIAVLKESTCTPHAPLKEKLQELDRMSGYYSVRVMCDALNVPRGTYYNHIFRSKGEDKWYLKRREELKVLILDVYEESGQCFGGDKVAAVLRSRGYEVSNKLASELMREMKLSSVRNQAKVTHEKLHETFTDHVRRHFDTSAPNQIWVSDVTYYRFRDRPYYICVILDLYSRKVIAYSIGRENTTNLVMKTIRSSVNSRQPDPGLIFHNDRGSNFQSNAVRQYLKNKGIIHSFSKPGSPHDNAVMESFFSTLKREELYRRTYRSERDLRKYIDKYIVFYNEKRPVKKFNYRTPNQRETDYFESHK